MKLNANCCAVLRYLDELDSVSLCAILNHVESQTDIHLLIEEMVEDLSMMLTANLIISSVVLAAPEWQSGKPIYRKLMLNINQSNGEFNCSTGEILFLSITEKGRHVYRFG